MRELRHSERSVYQGLAELLLPVADAELRDPALERLEARARREAKERAVSAWHCQWLKCKAARAAHEALDYKRLVATYYPEEGEKPDYRELRELWTLCQREWLRLMRVPAVTHAQVKEKRRLVPVLTSNCLSWLFGKKCCAAVAKRSIYGLKPK